MADAWGENNWGEGAWGQQSSVTITPTGLSTSFAIGTESVDAEIATGWGRSYLGFFCVE